jgi:sugar O-acyltransferase (sialic acid O-acetyltransferase NeuD family)
MVRPILIVGAGGHGAVLADALLAAGEPVIGMTDRASALHDTQVCGVRVIGDDSALSAYAPLSVFLVNGIGTVGSPRDAARWTRQRALADAGWEFASVRHPSAVISRFAAIANGAQLMAGCVVQVGATVGVGAIVNSAAVIEHGTTIGAWSHVAPGAVVCGDVSVGQRSLIGAGAVVRQGIAIGDDCVIAAGAVVVRDVASGSLVRGVPAAESATRPQAQRA